MKIMEAINFLKPYAADEFYKNAKLTGNHILLDYAVDVSKYSDGFKFCAVVCVATTAFAKFNHSLMNKTNDENGKKNYRFNVKLLSLSAVAAFVGSVYSFYKLKNVY